jgi:hypothetical protein
MHRGLGDKRRSARKGIGQEARHDAPFARGRPGGFKGEDFGEYAAISTSLISAYGAFVNIRLKTV